MSKVYRDYFPRNINQYTPLMTFAADVNNGKHLCSFGAPATADPDGIWDGVTADASLNTYTSADYAVTFDGSSTSVTTTAGMVDAPYGRCITLTGSSGSDHVCVVSGKDYLGQAMSETFTLSGVVVQDGAKAFKFVDSMITNIGQAGDTVDVGWSDRLGLPYNADHLHDWFEDTVTKQLGTYQIAVDIVDAVAADTVFGMSGQAGFITRMDTVTTVALQTGDATFTVEVGGTAVIGLSVLVAFSGSAIGAIDGDAATGDFVTQRLGANAAVEVVSDGGASTTGTVDARITVEQNALFTAAVATTATTSTGDTRGTVQPFTPCDGSVVYEAIIDCGIDNLHGVVQA